MGLVKLMATPSAIAEHITCRGLGQQPHICCPGPHVNSCSTIASQPAVLYVYTTQQVEKPLSTDTMAPIVHLGTARSTHKLKDTHEQHK